MAEIDRVVVINDFAVPEGGAGILAMLSIEQYRQRGYPVTFLTGQSSTPELEAMGVTVCGLGSKGLLELSTTEALSQGYHNGKAERMVTDWIRQNDTPGTVYHLHNWSQILSPSIFRSLRPVEARTLVTCHDFFNVCPNGGFLHFGKSEPCALRPLSIQCMATQCDRRSGLHKYWRVARQLHLNRISGFSESQCTFSFIHDQMQDKFVQSGFPARDLVTIPNPVAPWSRERIRAEENSSYLFVGRVGRDKGADVAIKAAGQAGQPITLVGTGELENNPEYNTPQTKFVGWCNSRDIIQHARKARALIVPSRVIEPFGLVILEAALSGLPVLVSDRAYLANDVEATGFGKKFSVADPSELAGLIGTLAQDDTLVEKMSHTAFNEASSLCHTPESWIGAHLDEFERKLRLANLQPVVLRRQKGVETLNTAHGLHHT